MWLPDPTLQLTAAWVGLAAAVGGLVNLTAGLFSVLSGRDHWPQRLRHFRRRTPASQDDQRRHGLTLVLNGAAVLIIIMGISINIFGVRDHSQGEPLNTLRFLLTLIGIAGSIACVIGAYSLSLTVRYTDSRLSTGRPPAEPTI
jgi:amino acid transporter